MAVRQETPESVEDLASLLQASSAGDRPIVPVGGGTSISVGNPADARSLRASMAAFSGISAYQPADLTLSVLAGTPMAEIQMALAEQGQELPIDVPLANVATVGGLIATGFAGPRRLGSGSLKDILLGCSFVTGDGRIAKAGGSVVKNVSGFEIPRLLHGSWGSLAVITSVNLKVTPIPKADVSIVRHGVLPSEMLELTQAVRTGFPSVVAIEADGTIDGMSMVVRLMGRSSALEIQRGELHRTLGFADGVDTNWWQRRHDRLATAGSFVQVVVSVRPRFIVEVIGELERRIGPPVEISTSPALGTARLRYGATIVAESFWPSLERSPLPGDARVAIEFAPDGWGDDVDRWGPDVDGTETMRAIKAEFDPKGILNRGRLFI